MSEFTNPSSKGASCSYAALGNYNADYSMNVPAQGRVVTGRYIVPQWSPISYDSLQNLNGGVQSCSGYSGILSAYGSSSENCNTQYKTSLCGARQ